jgi:KEOPS complex subunit Pcc1
MKRAFITFRFNSLKEAEVVLRSLSPETQHKIPRAGVQLSLSGNALSLKIVAESTNALRASLNSYLRWIKTAMDVASTALSSRPSQDQRKRE